MLDVSNMFVFASCQVRNLLVTMFLSQGIPVLNMGDEYGHSKNGMVDVDRFYSPTLSAA